MFMDHLPLIYLSFGTIAFSVVVQAFQPAQQPQRQRQPTAIVLHKISGKYFQRSCQYHNNQVLFLQVSPNIMVLKSTAASGDMDDNKKDEASSSASTNEKPHCEHVLFVECGFGNDSHGQNPTKAAVRACRNAIEFNSIPSINRLVPGGYESLKLDVILAIPPKYQQGLDLEAVKSVFPYGETKFTIQDGGMIAPSGIAIDSLGDKNDDMIVVCCAVTVGY
mmetsp:Transcript_12936/g.24302  ORF Transcript_12936/g.24302 Transcript_12936/m.24302 type:complete len:221 (+) Transcript_12936:133-795(+)